jgi:hypothetical protein
MISPGFNQNKEREYKQLAWLRTVLLHVTPDGFRNLPDIEQFTARNQLCPAVIGCAIHVDDFVVSVRE